jgi:hypothetical protein
MSQLVISKMFFSRFRNIQISSLCVLNARIVDVIRKIVNSVIRLMNARIAHWRSAVAGQVRGSVVQHSGIRISSVPLLVINSLSFPVSFISNSES